MQATEDNILPLSTPVQTRNGNLVDSLAIAEGTIVSVSTMAINRSEAFWGPDSRKFKPERWLNKDGLVSAKDIPGHRHLLTFSDGPTSCLGKGFLLYEFKVTTVDSYFTVSCYWLLSAGHCMHDSQEFSFGDERGCAICVSQGSFTLSVSCWRGGASSYPRASCWIHMILYDYERSKRCILFLVHSCTLA
jgi:hypothetical protein